MVIVQILLSYLMPPYVQVVWSNKLFPENETLSWSETCVPHLRLHGVLIQKTTVLISPSWF